MRLPGVALVSVLSIAVLSTASAQFLNVPSPPPILPGPNPYGGGYPPRFPPPQSSPYDQYGNSNLPGSMPEVGSLCVTQAGICPLPGLAPLGVQCGCRFQNGIQSLGFVGR